MSAVFSGCIFLQCVPDDALLEIKNLPCAKWRLIHHVLRNSGEG